MKKEIIIRAVCDFYGYSMHQIKIGRTQEMVMIRTILGYHLNKYCYMSMRECAKVLSIKYQGTISHHINRLDMNMAKDKYLKSDFENIAKLIDHRIENFNPIEYENGGLI